MDEPNTSIQPLMDRLLEIQKLPDGEEKNRSLRDLRAELERKGEVGAQRLFVGRDQSNTAAVVLSDPKGKPRLRLTVDSQGEPKVEFLDANGKVTQQLPQPAK